MNEPLVQEVERLVHLIDEATAKGERVDLIAEVDGYLSKYPEHKGLRSEIMKGVCDRLHRMGMERTTDLVNKAMWELFRQGGDR